MSAEAPVSGLQATSARDRHPALLMAALAGAILVQIVFARGFGALPGSARETWAVALSLSGFLALSGGMVVWAIWRARNMKLTWQTGTAIVVAGLLMRLPYFGAGPMLEDDHYRYLLDGAMVVKGLSPYALSPQALLAGASPALSGLVAEGRNAIEVINFPDLRSIYPGTAQILFALAHGIAPWKMDGLRLVILGAEITTALLIWHILRRSGGPAIAVALYWCNPLMAFSLTGQAHIDAALAPPVLLSLLAAWRNRGILAGITLGLAVGIKLWPVLLAPLIARALWPDRKRLITFALALGSMTLLTCGPLIWASLSASAGLTAYAGGWSINNAPFAWASYLFFRMIGPGTGEMVLRASIVLIAAASSLFVGLAARPNLSALAGRAALLAALLFYLSPAQFPWYAAWFLPLAAAAGSWVLAFGAVGLPVYFLFFPLAAAGLRDFHSYGLSALHLLPLLVALLMYRRLMARAVTP